MSIKTHMNGFILVGAALTILGVVVGLYGGLVQSRRESKKNEEKFNGFQQELGKLKNQPFTPKVGVMADSLNDRVRGWAKDFVKNMDRRQIDIQESRLADTKKALELSDRVRPTLQAAITGIRNAVNAYNAEAKAHFEVNLPDLPDNVIDGPGYSGSVVVGDKGEWDVALQHALPPTEYGPTSALWIEMYPWPERHKN